jgi:WhiB family redox-sensing transcriptional regulator
MSGNPRIVYCVCCRKRGRHGGRGLISACYNRHTHAGTLEQYPPVRYDREWLGTYRQPPPAQSSASEQPADDGTWGQRAACRTEDPDIFFPVSYTESIQSVARRLARARGICGRCPVIDECLDYAITTDQPEGIWAGTTPKQRRELQHGQHLERTSA